MLFSFERYSSNLFFIFCLCQGPGGSLGRHSAPAKDDHLTDADDEILETLVKTATTQPARNEPRIRKKARYGDRKSCE